MGSLSLRCFSRLAGTFSVCDAVSMGSTMSLRSFIRCGDSVSVGDALHFGAANTYIRYDSNNLETYVGGQKTMTLNAGTSSLHGTWTSETAVTTSDRRLKKNIQPIMTTIKDSYSRERGRSKIDSPESLINAASSIVVLEDDEDDFPMLNDNNNATTGNNATTTAAASTTGGSGEKKTPVVSWLLRELRPVSYNFKTGPEAKEIRFGFIADEIEKVLPQVVREIPDSSSRKKVPGEGPLKGIIYNDLIAVLTAAVKDMDKRMVNFNMRLEMAEAELDRLDKIDPMYDFGF